MRNTDQHNIEIRSCVHMLRENGAWQMKVLGGLGQRPGIPDIIACVKTRFVAIEVKTGGGRLNSNQVNEREKLEARGSDALYLLVASREEAERLLVEAGLIPAPLFL